MRKLIMLSMFLLGASSLLANDVYTYVIDLTRVNNDKVYVELAPPSIKQDEITFYLPKIIPGTYSIADYGRMVSDFQAFDKKGRLLEIERLDNNSWKIRKANKLAKISYWVDDTYDTPIAGPNIFQPAGTNIEEGKNFLINTSGFFGYFEGMKEMQFKLNIIRPEGFYGATGLIPSTTNADLSAIVKLEGNEQASQSKKVDQFVVDDYDLLIDSPLMYSEPDTAFVKVADTDVLIASYSPNNVITANEIAASIKEVLMAQKEYLGGELPVDKYAFIFYFTDQPVMSYGALEHSYSSVYYMPETRIENMNQQLRDFAAHEFFHIVTPLTVHSEEIENFDFNNPQMSKHLWMYEGVTEYFAGNMQVKYGLITQEEYLDILRQKMIVASNFLDTVAFTDISKFTLEDYSDQYYNVYQKGALIGLALDIKLLQLSDGKYGLQDLMKDLSRRYGKKKAFDDEELFGVITEITYQEIGDFLNAHVGGPTPLPYEDILDLVGIEFAQHKNVMGYSLGITQNNITIASYNGKNKLAIGDIENLNAMGDSLGFEEGDILLGINREELPDLGPELGAFIGKVHDSLSEGDTLTYTVIRTNAEGKQVEVELSSEIFKVEMPQQYVLGFSENPSEEQIALQKAWLKPRN
ncbi:peptidase, M61 (glycyl aminopeptidase) family protein [Fulvivirga imtechensis AK7]|uniref:Peptidase, M61 (Glycyl aminopeptidase) family protein n=1 Tax=Fulvivirga imtechensis AK7 TaxID=1237149 RepID=L8JZ49_9BACT|nr:peptidase, M61 (glycyl aminopeptidase) family protein [Fulvivirga imtechensis]ELR72924.1 peptidase, M61 (glycyl aminopeptidase) family protein [Fulvivirga imtechensis AK7]